MKKLAYLVLFTATFGFAACTNSDSTDVAITETESTTIPSSEVMPADSYAVAPESSSQVPQSSVTQEVEPSNAPNTKSAAEGAAVATKGQSQRANPSSENDKDGDGCPDDLMCTMDFRSISIAVKDAAGRPVVLDRVQVTLAGTNTPVLGPNGDAENLGAAKQGRYMVANDNSMRLVGKDGKNVDFKGYKNGKQIVAHQMVIGHDCCHIQLLKGSQTVVVK